VTIRVTSSSPQCCHAAQASVYIRDGMWPKDTVPTGTAARLSMPDVNTGTYITDKPYDVYLESGGTTVQSTLANGNNVAAFIDPDQPPYTTLREACGRLPARLRLLVPVLLPLHVYASVLGQLPATLREARTHLPVHACRWLSVVPNSCSSASPSSDRFTTYHHDAGCASCARLCAC
jgi:hypothetical protein